MTTKLAIAGEQRTLIRRLGGGATSEVWLASDASGRRVALKIGREGTERAPFADEAERLLFIDSPRCARVIGAGITSAKMEGPVASIPAATPYLALEWIDGEPLSRLNDLDDAARLSLALVVARDIGQALVDLHGLGAAHGDIKPDNIVVQRAADGVASAFLVDLGLSESTVERAVRGGTPRYLAPEVFEATPRGDARARDLWALGLTIAELVAPELERVQRPHEAQFDLAVPGQIELIVRSLLNAAPGARPQAGWIFRRALAALGETESEAATIERRRRAIRSSYLRVRRNEILRAARAERAETSVGGRAGEWLVQAIAVAREVAELRGSVRDAQSVALGELDVVGRSRWMMALAGPAAASWPARALRSDAELSDLLHELARRQDPESLTLAELEGSAPERPRIVGEPLELAVVLAGGRADASSIEAAERHVLHGSAPESLVLLLARSLRLSGQLGRAGAILGRSVSAAARVELAETQRRAGDRAAAEQTLHELLAGDIAWAARARGLAILARLRLDAGEPKAALELLANAPETTATLEVRALCRLSLGARASAQQDVERARILGGDDEERARIEALAGMIAHESGDSHIELELFQRAAELAGRAGAVVEEATYLTGLAAAATQLGEFGEALRASRRASLLFEHLGRPVAAARAVLARAAVYAAAGACAEAREAADEAIARANMAGDRRCLAYAHIALADVLGEADPEGAEHAERALSLVGASDRDDWLRAAARVLRHGKNVELARLDELAQRPDAALDARLDWWAARARASLRRSDGVRGDAVLRELVALASVRAPAAVRGPAFAAGAALATRLGNGETARRLIMASAEAARELITRAPDELRSSIEGLAWVRAAEALPRSSVAPEQLAEVEALVRALGTRDNLRSLLDHVLDALLLWTGVERGLLLLRAPGGRLRPRAARNLARSDLTSAQLELSHSLAERALELGEPVIAVDAAGELPEIHASVHALKLRSVLAVPLVARGEALGVVYLDDRVRRGAFGAPELEWVRLVATLAAVAIADARDQLLLRRAARRARRAEAKLANELARREAELDVATRELARQKARETRFSYDAIVGKSEAVRGMLAVVDRVTASDVPVLILGESGSGKELIARAIHDNGTRAKGPFVTENCSAIPEGLLESALFGHVRGAFTGASRPRAGLFEIADGGTLFLDEIAEMSLGMQSKLLRVLEDGEVRPVGSESARHVDVRIIGATHRDMDQLVDLGRFRKDLYYRLNVISIRVPPLRERRSDIPLLLRHLIGVHGRGREVRFSSAALEVLNRHLWPGNVRQLENEVRRALVLADDVIGVEHLTPEIVEQARSAAEDVGLNVRRRVDALETELVSAALRRTGGNQTRAAELLGMSRFGLQKMMKRLKIDAEGVDERSSPV